MDKCVGDIPGYLGGDPELLVCQIFIPLWVAVGRRCRVGGEVGKSGVSELDPVLLLLSRSITNACVGGEKNKRSIRVHVV